MYHLSPLTVVLWIVGILLLAYALGQTYRRGLHREFPIFFGYLVFHLFTAVSTLWVTQHLRVHTAYSYDWSCEALDGPVSLALIYELFAKSLAPYGSIQKLGKVSFLVTTLALIVLGFWMLTSDPHSWMQKIDSAMISMDRSLDFARLALLFLLFGFHRILGLNWRHHLFGIAIGLAISSAVALLSGTLRLQVGVSWWRAYIYLYPFSYDLGCGIWAFYLTSAESRLNVENLPTPNFLAKWNEAIAGVLAQSRLRRSVFGTK